MDGWLGMELVGSENQNGRTDLSSSVTVQIKDGGPWILGRGQLGLKEV